MPLPFTRENAFLSLPRQNGTQVAGPNPSLN